jgi:NADH-quinone oxidoreductase subunit H
MVEFFEGYALPAIVIVLQILAIIVPLLVAVAYLTYAERKVIGAMQMRKGPNVVGPFGLLQPFADGVKLLFKETILPAGANKVVFVAAPMLTFILAMVAWAVIPVGKGLVISDINVGMLYLFAISSLGVYGVIMAGWASNSKYPFLGALRSAAQMVSYEVPMGFAVVSVLLMSGTLSLVGTVEAQREAGLWFIFPGILAFGIYFICGIAENNRNPFDLPEAEAELVAGFHTEYSGMKFAMFYLAEYINMMVVSSLAVILFFGGWLRPFPNVEFLAFLDVIPPVLWFAGKVLAFIFLYIWFRGTFPRYRFDQLMAVGWKWLLPLSLANVALVALGVLILKG